MRYKPKSVESTDLSTRRTKMPTLRKRMEEARARMKGATKLTALGRRLLIANW